MFFGDTNRGGNACVVVGVASGHWPMLNTICLAQLSPGPCIRASEHLSAYMCARLLGPRGTRNNNFNSDFNIK